MIPSPLNPSLHLQTSFCADGSLTQSALGEQTST